MLVTPTLEWQDHLSSCYAFTDKLRTSDSSVNLGTRSSPQRRRLDKDSSTLADWDSLYTLDPASGGCGLRLPESTNCTYHSFLISDSDDTDDPASMVGELSLDENKEVRIGVTYLTRYQYQVQVRYHSDASGLHLLSQADRTDERRIGGVWWVN